MLNLDPGKLLIIGVVGIILLGPDRLPQVARQLGGAWRAFNEYRHRMEAEVRGSLPDLPPTSEIARLARSPSALLNHLSNMDAEATEGEAANASRAAEAFGRTSDRTSAGEARSGSSPEGRSPNGSASNGSASNGAASDRAASDRAASNRAASDRAASNRAASNRAESDRRPANGTPANGTPANGTPAPGAAPNVAAPARPTRPLPRASTPPPPDVIVTGDPTLN